MGQAPPSGGHASNPDAIPQVTGLSVGRKHRWALIIGKYTAAECRDSRLISGGCDAGYERKTNWEAI